MYSFGHESWIKYGWGPDYNDEFKSGDLLHVDFANNGNRDCLRIPSLEAAKYTVDLIQKTYPPPFSLMCSGGVDSQVMLWAWKISNVPFRVISVRYITDGVWYNEFDLLPLIEFCNQHNIEIDFKDFDVINFVENDLFEVARKFDCDSPQISTYIKMADNLVNEGTAIFSGNFVFYTSPFWYSHLGLQNFAAWLSKNSHKRLIPFFLLHTPEIGYSFQLKDPTVLRVLRAITKNNLYLENGYPLVIPEDKYTGFEKIKEYYDQFPERITPRTRFIYSTMDSPRVFDLLFRYPLGVNKSRKMPKIEHLLPSYKDLK